MLIDMPWKFIPPAISEARLFVTTVFERIIDPTTLRKRKGRLNGITTLAPPPRLRARLLSILVPVMLILRQPQQKKPPPPSPEKFSKIEDAEILMYTTYVEDSLVPKPVMMRRMRL
jgi:hypothetical protein